MGVSREFTKAAGINDKHADIVYCSMKELARVVREWGGVVA